MAWLSMVQSLLSDTYDNRERVDGLAVDRADSRPSTLYCACLASPGLTAPLLTGGP